MTVVSIHQPGYIPWLGFFKKILYSDVFVFLDDVQYVKRQWHNRNQIRTKDGAHFLSVPIEKNSGKKLNEVKISYDTDWNITHKKTIKYNYIKSAFFDNYWKFFENIYSKKYEYLIDLNIEIIRYLMKEFDITTQIIFSSTLNIKEKKSDLNLEICKSLNADIYLSGISGKEYLDVDSFSRNNISVKFQNFQHPIYSQVYSPFLPNMGAIDLLFNEGKKSSDILQKAMNF